MDRQATAVAHPNIALVKYWGKRPGQENLPAVGSLSITLDTLRTRTRARRLPNAAADRFVLDGAAADPATAARLTAFLTRLRARAQAPCALAVDSDNNFPTGAGLASSASGFAALALACSAALDLALTPGELSVLARTGSGSAARSVYGGFVRMHAGSRADGADAVAAPLAAADAWPLAVVVAVTSRAVKAVGSTVGMERSRTTSPYYAAWCAAQQDDLRDAERAVAARDFAALAAVAEHSCLKMHALAMATRPPLLYWNAATLAGMHAVQALRAAGHATFFTVDAGPQLKAVCLPDAAAAVAAVLRALPGVVELVCCGLGPGAHLLAAGETA